ncbi:hypothetical protein B0T20DRAFT_255774 [Sordaria brevicollis]|uniref:Secreted protein n=1 Tax=Sordaria brevicollis TaxID=83679 RepID=A0AAE0PCK0_SORBR|nr:hypothetical protein B0T20DRAFT_255774 [Sordaria brevicollis]
MAKKDLCLQYTCQILCLLLVMLPSVGDATPVSHIHCSRIRTPTSDFSPRSKCCCFWMFSVCRRRRRRRRRCCCCFILLYLPDRRQRQQETTPRPVDVTDG